MGKKLARLWECRELPSRAEEFATCAIERRMPRLCSYFAILCSSTEPRCCLVSDADIAQKKLVGKLGHLGEGLQSLTKIPPMAGGATVFTYYRSTCFRRCYLRSRRPCHTCTGMKHRHVHQRIGICLDKRQLHANNHVYGYCNFRPTVLTVEPLSQASVCFLSVCL